MDITEKDMKDGTRELLTPLYLKKGLKKADMEALYKVGYDLYQAGSYAKAETVFKGLVALDVMNERYRMALAGALQAQEKYQEAIDQYGTIAGFINLLNADAPLRAAECLEKLGAVTKAAMARAQVQYIQGKAVSHE